MNLNPYLNAVLASAYIAGVAQFMHFISSIRHNTPDTILDGMAFLSLFVFSASVMAFLFFYQPAMLLIEKRYQRAVSYFLKTLATFGAITVVVITLMSLQ